MFVETPEIYLLAKCSDSLADKMAYVETRMEDIAELESPLTMKNGIQFEINLSIQFNIFT